MAKRRDTPVWTRETKRVWVNPGGNILIGSERVEPGGGRKTYITVEFSGDEWAEIVAAVNAADRETTR